MDRRAVKHIEVTMVRQNLENLPRWSLPNGYAIRRFRSGDEALWAEIETAAGEFRAPADALAHFRREFGGHVAEMEARCFFLLDEAGRGIGTVTAWYSECFQGRPAGRLHWVGIVPAYQGKGLAKPMVARALEELAHHHDRAYLTTQTTSWVAVKVYLDFGFAPVPGTPDCDEAWALLASLTGHPALAARR